MALEVERRVMTVAAERRRIWGIGAEVIGAITGGEAAAGEGGDGGEEAIGEDGAGRGEEAGNEDRVGQTGLRKGRSDSQGLFSFNNQIAWLSFQSIVHYIGQ